MTKVLKTYPLEPFGIEAELALQSPENNPDLAALSQLYMRDGLLVVRGCQHFDLACAVRSIRRLNHGHAVASFIRRRNVHGEAASPLPGAAGVMSRLALFQDVNMTAN